MTESVIQKHRKNGVLRYCQRPKPPQVPNDASFGTQNNKTSPQGVSLYFMSFLAKTYHSPRGSSSSASRRLLTRDFVFLISFSIFGIWALRKVFLLLSTDGSSILAFASLCSFTNLHHKTVSNQKTHFANKEKRPKEHTTWVSHNSTDQTVTWESTAGGKWRCTNGDCSPIQNEIEPEPPMSKSSLPHSWDDFHDPL